VASRGATPPGNLRPQAARPAEYVGHSADRHQRPGRAPFGAFVREQARLAHRFTCSARLRTADPVTISGPQQLFHRLSDHGQPRPPDHPDLFAVVDKLRPDRSRPLPNNVGVPPIPYLGAAYLGPAHEPFAVHGDPNDPQFHVPNIGLREGSIVTA